MTEYVNNPGKYGSATYYSSAVEESEIAVIGKISSDLGALGSARTGVDTFLVRLPAGSVETPSVEQGSFTVVFTPSQFTVEQFDDLRDNVRNTFRSITDNNRDNSLDPRTFG